MHCWGKYVPELRSRVLPPDFWLNFNLGSLGDSERLLFQFLVQYADDFGRFEFDPHLMRGLFWMYQPERTSTELVRLFNRIVERCHYLGYYEANGHNYYAFTNWADYQTLRHPKKSSIPIPESVVTHRTFPESAESCGKFPETPAHIVTVLDSVVVPVSVSEKIHVPQKPTVSESHAAAFEEFWKLYPKSIDRSASLKAWMRNVKPADVPEVMRALKLYVARMAGKEIQFVKRGATFVNSGWREELALAAKAPVVGAIQRPLITEEPPTPPDLLEIRQKRYAAVEARAAELRAEAEASQK